MVHSRDSFNLEGEEGRKASHRKTTDITIKITLILTAMPISKKILNHLDKNKVKYEILKHKTVYTAFDLANTLKKKLSEIAKTLLIKADNRYVLVVLPAHYKLDLGKLKKILKSKKVEIVKEKVMSRVLKIKPGAMVPFGTLHKVGVVLDRTLLKTERIIMGAGSFTESFRLKIKDFLKAEKPAIGSVGKRWKRGQ